MWQTVLLTGIAVLGQAGAGPAGVPASVDESIKIHSVFDFVTKGGPTMGAIVLCSLVSLTVIVERLLVIRRRAVVSPQFQATLGAVSADQARAIALCDADPSPVAKVLGAAIKNRGQGKDQIEKAVRSAGGRVLVKLRQRMRLLSALPQVATMLGLLGTIFGMIKTFQAVAASGQSLGKTETLAKGIFEAWTNTAAGLIVAIPVLIAYHILMSRIDAMAAALDQVASEWIDREVPIVTVQQSAVVRTIVPLANNDAAIPVAPAAVALNTAA